MNQFDTVVFGGYRKDMVDERLQELVDQIERLRKEKADAGEREERLKKELEEARSQAAQARSQAAASPSGGEAQTAGESPAAGASQREEQLKKELADALARLRALEEQKDKTPEYGGLGFQYKTPPEEDGAAPADERASLKDELAAALQWSETLEAELRQVRDEKSSQTQTRLAELERTKSLNRRILELEDALDEAEAEHRREVSRLREQLDHQTKAAAATERILAQAEEEARTMIVEAQERAQELERQTELDVRAKKQAAAQALDGARAQIVQYLDAFNATRNQLSVTYNELGALVDQIPQTDETVIELDGEGEDWSYIADEGE